MYGTEGIQGPANAGHISPTSQYSYWVLLTVGPAFERLKGERWVLKGKDNF